MSDIDPGNFRAVLGTFPTGVTVITAYASEGPVGLAIGSFASVSLEPPLVSFCPSDSSASWPRIRDAGNFCVNVLAEDQAEVCGVFAGKGDDKFDGVDWTPSDNGAPRLDGVVSWIDCDIREVMPAGDHVIVVGRVTALGSERDGVGPLLFLGGSFGRFQL